ncbi:Gfo/Idh/MocA family protein [Actinomadura litoris]|uniref:Gfo/Idh/MocA family protein n=1 Tax=Actinomadura litoris TaxID=2678616 RepID=UPI001FA79243|nr:Gfo/Idh/MocA family oxidoreductase [Actinomadura litoris]
MRVTICGFGSAGRQHAEAIERLPDVAVHSVLESNTAVTTGSFTRSVEWRAVLEDRDIDAVALCLPPGGRAELAAEAIAAGKAVLLEKPPCMSVEELDRLTRAGGTVGVMLQHRFRLPDQVLAAPFTAAAGTLLVSRFRDPATHYTGWRADSGQALGGITAHLGVHYLDMACQLLGAVESVDVHDYRSCTPGIDTRVSGLVRFASGSTLALTIAADVPARIEQLVIAGDERCVTVTDGAVTLREGRAERTFPAGSTSEMRTKVYEDFARGPGLSSLERTRPVTRILDEVRKAATGW